MARALVRRAFAAVDRARHLRACDRVGARVRCSGPIWVDNAGSILLGDDVTLGAGLGRVRLSSACGGVLRIGDRVTIEHGSWLSAAREVEVGSDVVIGPCCVIADADADTLEAREDATPIHIGDGVRLAARVIVRPGARIGAGAIVRAGSVVEGTIPPGALVSGIPATVTLEAGTRIAATSLKSGAPVPTTSLKSGAPVPAIPATSRESDAPLPATSREAVTAAAVAVTRIAESWIADDGAATSAPERRPRPPSREVNDACR